MESKEPYYQRVNGWNIRLAHFLAHYLTTHRVWPFGAIQVFLCQLLVASKSEAIICPTNYNFDIIVHPGVDKGLEKSIYYYGSYEAGTISVIGKYLRTGDTFIDIGANIGFVSLCAANIVGSKGQIYSFEPEPDTHQILQNNIQINGFDQIIATEIALGSEPGSAPIFGRTTEGNRGAATMMVENNDTVGTEVQVETLDNFVDRHQISNIRMIKLDVEGWEKQVLLGAKKLLSGPDAPIICLEVSGTLKERTDLIETLMSINNYRLFRLQKSKAFPSQLIEVLSEDDLPEHDNLFGFVSGGPL